MSNKNVFDLVDTEVILVCNKSETPTFRGKLFRDWDGTYCVGENSPYFHPSHVQNVHENVIVLK